MKRAFTLLELLVVIGIMGLLGTASIGGYRAVTRGMEERGAVDNASRFVHAAFQRSRIDRQPVAVYYWNETIKGETDDDNAIVVGKAVAVRRAGRISRANSNAVYDEFADLNLTYPTNSPSSSGSTTSAMYLYSINNSESATLNRSKVSTFVFRDDSITETDPLGEPGTNLPSGMADLDTSEMKIPMYGFEILDGYNSWRRGEAYGFEFQNLTLPHNYIFGDKFNSSEIGASEATGIIFSGKATEDTGGNTIDIYALRPNASGSLTAVKVGKTKSPKEDQ